MSRPPNLARFDIDATVLRRDEGPLTGGKARGPWREVFATRVRFVPVQGVEQVENGLALDRLYADVTFRAGPQASAVTAGDKFRIRGIDYAIDSVIPADRNYRFIRARVSIRAGG